MTDRTKVAVALATVCAIAILSALITYLVMDAARERDKAQATANAKQEQIDALTADMAKRDSEQSERERRFESLMAKVSKPADVKQAIAQPIGNGGLVFNPFKEVAAPTPDAPNATQLEVPQENVVPLYKFLATCDERANALNHCESDKNDLQKQRDLFKDKAQAWETAAKHGSKMRRFLSFAVPIGCASAAAVVTRSQDPRIVASSTLAAGVGCKLAIP